MKTKCEAVNPSNNFENLIECSNRATTELTFAGGKVANYCRGCVARASFTMLALNGAEGAVVSFRKV